MPSKSTRTSKKSADPAALLALLEAEYGSLDGVAIGDSLDLVLFSHLVLHLPLAEACRAYQRFKTQFVDWNEVRISSAKEVQEVVRHGDAPLELAILIKQFLDRLFTEHHHIGIEFLRERSLSEIRSFFKKAAAFSESTVHLLLASIKDYPVVPLEPWMHPCVERLGLTKKSATALQKQKDLFEAVPPEQLLLWHCCLVELARQTCVTDPAEMGCPQCAAHSECPYPKKKTKATSRRTAKKKTSRSAGSSPRSRNGTGKRSK